MAKPKTNKGTPSPGPGKQDIDIDEAEREDRPQPGDDAHGDDEKLKENRKRLNVNEEHKTPEMRKQHRGTFP